MSAIFMSHHRFSTINPDDIARLGARLSLNSISFKPISEDDDEDYEDHEADGEDEEKRPGGTRADSGHRRRSTKDSVRKKASVIRKLQFKWNRLSQKYGLKHIIPILLLVIYSVAGALMFNAVEKPHAEQRRQTVLTKLERNRRWVADAMIWRLNLQNNTSDYTVMLDILKKADDNNSLPLPELVTWNIWSALFYVGSIYTTIGYGSVYPETNLGYALTIVYAFFGVPLVLAILSDIGQLLAHWSSKIWRNLMSRIHKRRKRSKTDLDIVLPESGVPITLCLLLTFGWLLFCSGLICIWEKKWSYFTAFYFFFISLTTIGLGDIVPSEPRVMIFLFGFVLIGLCLVSMTLGVVQEHITLFLYRMMIELQKECEAMLANGEDVEKVELLEKIWNKQPWYMRKFMPAFINESANQRLDDYAGTAITDTAVNMGLIPPPPNYRPSSMHVNPMAFKAPSLAPPSLLPPSALAVSAPLAMIAEAKMEPRPQVTIAQQGAQAIVTPSKGKHGTGVQGPLASMLAMEQGASVVSPMNRAPTMEDLYPGGRVVIGRSKSCRLQRAGEGGRLNAQQRLERALKTRTDATQTSAAAIGVASPEVAVQTDLVGPDILDIVMKRDTVSTLSLASWYEEEEAMPFNLGQLEKLTADEGQQLFRVTPHVQQANLDESRADAFVQTDDLSSSSASEEDEYVSALETKSLIPPTPLRHISKFVQTLPWLGRSLSQFHTCSIEIQTVTPRCENAEIQTSVPQRANVEIQCHPEPSVDEEAQTSDELQRYPQPDLLPRNLPVDAFVDKSVQTISALQYEEKEIQTVATRTRNQETQVESTFGESVETQTDLWTRHSSLSQRGSVAEGGTQMRVRIQGDWNDEDNEEEDEDEEYVTDATGKPAPGWVYSAWISSKERQGSLRSVPEDEELDEEFEEEEMMEDEDNNDTDLIDLRDFSEESESPPTSEGVNLPAVTAEFNVVDDEVQLDEVLAMAEEGRKLSRASRRSKRSSRSSDVKEVITAAIATQTEEIITRRQSFPRDAFTSRNIQAKLTFEMEPETEEKKGPGWFRWITQKKRQQKGSICKSDHKGSGLIPSVEIAIQTDAAESILRDIMIQTDDSYLLRAKKFENLRSHRTKSLAVAVAPHLKQRLNKMAEAVSGKTTIVGPGESSKGKKGSIPKRR